MNFKQKFNKYKNQPMFKAAIGIWIVVFLVKIAKLGFVFGQWLKGH